MQLDRNGLEVLGRDDCLALLARCPVGRVVVTEQALPAAFPVNYALLGEDVVFRTRAGSKLEAASAEAVVAFEADEIDPVGETGWSVLIQGWAGLIVDAAELARVDALRVRPWAPGPDFHYVRIRSEIVSGRRVLPTTAVAAPRGPTFGGCPACGSDQLVPVMGGVNHNFVCNRCAACWHVDGRHVRRVRPVSCVGCSFKPICSAAFERDRLIARIEAAGDDRRR